MNENTRLTISTWEFHEDGARYQGGFDSDGYDRKGFGPDGLDKFGFDEGGYIDIYGGLRKRDFTHTRDGRGNKYTYRATDEGILVLFPRDDLTYYDSYDGTYRFYENLYLGSASIHYRTFDSYQEYKAYMGDSSDEYGISSDLESMYNIGFGGADWGI